MVTPFAEIAVTPLGFEKAALRMVMRNGEPWWVLNDVCGVLGHSNPRKAAARLWEWQKGVASNDTLGGRQDLAIVNEAGIYKLILTSRMPGAEEFERWLTCEVLPSIRKHGCYPPPPEPSPLAIDTETPWGGKSKTFAKRFNEELVRWEARPENAGYRFAGTVHGFSKHVVVAINSGFKMSLSNNQVRALVHAGLDALYVLNGERSLTDGELRLRDAYRAADRVARTRLLQSAFALPAPIDPEQDFISQA